MNADIAASVAQALGLLPAQNYSTCWEEWIEEKQSWFYLDNDGSNLFDPYWQVRCRDWLLEHHYAVSFDFDSEAYKAQHAYWLPGNEETHSEERVIDCPAAEFCARAIHELTKAAP